MPSNLDHDPYFAGVFLATAQRHYGLLGLKERLGKALGSDLVGIIDESTMETWTGDTPVSKREPIDALDDERNTHRKRRKPN